MSSATFLGIDSGLSGACALVSERGRVYWVENIPTMRTGTKSDYDWGALAGILRQNDHNIALAMTETIQPFPGIGRVACVKMGLGMGGVLGILTVLNIPYELVHPQRWQRALLQGRARGKQANLLAARRLYPKDRALITTDGQADAVLLATYARQRFHGA
jgi:hypothetical protein